MHAWLWQQNLLELLLALRVVVQNHHDKFTWKLALPHTGLKLNGSWLGSKRTIAEGGLPLSACRVAYTLLQNATNNFSSSNLLGEGSFSHVYKANLDYGIFAAVKRLEKNGKQGENAFQVDFFPQHFLSMLISASLPMQSVHVAYGAYRQRWIWWARSGIQIWWLFWVSLVMGPSTC